MRSGFLDLMQASDPFKPWHWPKSTALLMSRRRGAWLRRRAD